MPSRMRSKVILLAAAASAALLPSPALAWDPIGHQVVAHVAWSRMRPETRARAVALLRAAPPDADLASLLPVSTKPLPVRERTLFALASTWPDIVRDEDVAERWARYHHGTWHYIDVFWDRPHPAGPARRRLDIPQGRENVVERLQRFASSVGDQGRPAPERAIELAWVLHLVGDLHNPVHTSSRVTAAEPEGDRGANLFALDQENQNLHWFWDSAISRGFRRRSMESEDVFVTRVAVNIALRHPASEFAGRLTPAAFERWAREGHDIDTTVVYPANLRRGRRPPAGYRRMVDRIAEERVALAGYRLAAVLDAALAP